MKFTDGYWLMRSGVQPHFAIQASEFESGTDALTVYAATQKVNGRGDTLNQALLTVRFSTAMKNIIRVQAWHHKGAGNPAPQFGLHEVPTSPTIEISPQFASLTSGELTVRIPTAGDWRVEYRAAGRELTASGWRALGFVDTPAGRFIHDQLNLGVGEVVVGLGERFTAFVKNGQVVDIWNEDGGTSSEQTYKNIPFYLTNRGYGVFVNHPEKVSFEVASEKVERVQFSVPGEQLDYFVIYGPTPKEILERYTALTGRPALPPAWSFGLWLSTSFTTDYDEKTVTGMIDEMKRRGIPLRVFHFDCFWMKEFRWCDFTWDERCFPDPAAMLQRLKARGLCICVWINPYIAQRSSLFDEAAAAGYLLKRPDGGVWQTDMWQAGMGIVDFTNPAARAWYQSKLRALLQMGVDVFKTDFGERIPTEVVYFDGSDPHKMHNYYSFLYNQAVFELLEAERGKGQAVVFARSATAGGQQFPVHWGGDSTASFESMAESLRAGLSLGLSGFGFWSHDIGGFEQTAAAQVYKRWCAFGLLSSHSRLHGSSSYRVPWAYDEEAVAVLAQFTRLKCSLMPYLFAAAVQAHTLGYPVLRAMLLEFPDDPACTYLDRQYMLGDNLLVAPVFSEDGSVDYYLPAGRWTHLLTGKTIDGPRWVREVYDFMSLPLFVRPNSVIPFGAQDERPDYDFSDGVTLRIYALESDSRVILEIPAKNGWIETRFIVTAGSDTITITRTGPQNNWQILLVNLQAAGANVDIQATPQGSFISVEKSIDTVIIKIQP